MYLRTTRRRNADGSTVEYHQLAENVWDRDKGCAVAKVVYNFGRAAGQDAEALRRLAKSILRVFPSEGALKADAGVEMVDAWPHGGLHALDSLWRELGIDRVVAEEAAKAGTGQPFERALFAMVANRALQPYSKLYGHDHWLGEDVFFAGRAELALHHFYGAMDFLEKHKESLEKSVFFQTADLFTADVDLIFYDTTSLHFEVDEEDTAEAQATRAAGGRKYPAMRKRGHSKNGRGDAPQVVVGLAVTRDGLPVRSWVFPGQTADVTTVERVKQDLRGWRLGRCVFVGDAGMNSAENRRTLALGGGKYILASRMRAGDEVTKRVVTRPGRYHRVAENLRVKEVVIGDGERRQRYVVCHNPDEAERQKRHRAEVLRELDQELARMADPGDGEAHSKRACELLASERTGRYVRRTRGGGLRVDRAAVARHAKLDGKWVVTSNDDTLTPEDLALGYKQLMRVEQCWRTMKSGLRTRPVFHYKPHRISAHVTLCVLALLLERIAELRGGDTWRNLLARLDSIKVVEYKSRGAQIRQTTEVPPDVAALLKRLRVPPPPKIHAAGPEPPA